MSSLVILLALLAIAVVIVIWMPFMTGDSSNDFIVIGGAIAGFVLCVLMLVFCYASTTIKAPAVLLLIIAGAVALAAVFTLD